MLKKILLSCFAIFGLTFLLSSNSYADVEDVTYTLDSSSINLNLCGSSSSVNCSDYQYIYFERNFNTPHSGYIQFRYPYYGGIIYPQFVFTSPSMLLEFDSYQNGFYFQVTNISGLQSGESVIVTFTNTNPYLSSGSGVLNISENGTFDVTNYATAIVNVPQTISDLPPYSQIVVDSFWKYHVAIAGGLASIFAIFVVYRIIKSRLR